MEAIDRRTFLVTSGAATATLAAGTPAGASAGDTGLVFLSTWQWGIEANRLHTAPAFLS